ncbi:MAG: hypothetical protein GOV01_00735, partial [Candidatus Altiarchaeota archaeon]|nr:hypothetical protein [Candidatus Altiarchaeota archaeon]
MKKSNKIDLQPRDLIAGGVVLLAVIMIINSITLMNVKGVIGNKLAEFEESNRPAELKMTVISTSCKDCFSVSQVINDLKNQNVKITEENYVPAENAEGLIETYGITRLPTLVLTGEVDKATISGFEKSGDALVFKDVKAPFIDGSDLSVRGRINSVLIKDARCDSCLDLGIIVDNLENSGIKFSEKKELQINSQEATALIGENSIQKIPALLLSKDVALYDAWESVQARTSDNYFIMEASAPYVNTSTKEIRGLVGLVMLTDESCSDCYDVTIHKQVLPRFGLAIAEENTYSIQSSEGAEIVKKY